MLIIRIIKNLVVCIQVRFPLWVSNIILLVPQDETVEIEIEIQMALWVMVDIIPIDLMVNLVVPMVSKIVVMVAPDDPYGASSDSSSSSEFRR